MKEKWPTVTIKIFGENYRIKGVRDPEYIQELAIYVDKKMKEMAANNQITSSPKIMILAALNIADELYSSEKKNKIKNTAIKKRIDNLISLIDEERK